MMYDAYFSDFYFTSFILKNNKFKIKSWVNSLVVINLVIVRDKPRNVDFGLLLWTWNDSGLPSVPLTLSQTLKTFL